MAPAREGRAPASTANRGSGRGACGGSRRSATVTVTVTLGSWLAAVTGSYQAALMHFPVSTGCVGAASASQPF